MQSPLGHNSSLVVNNPLPIPQNQYLSGIIQNTKKYINESIQPQTMAQKNNMVNMPNVMLLKNLGDLPTIPKQPEMEI